MGVHSVLTSESEPDSETSTVFCFLAFDFFRSDVGLDSLSLEHFLEGLVFFVLTTSGEDSLFNNY